MVSFPDASTGKSYKKPYLILYQILRATEQLHSRGIVLGEEFDLSRVHLTNELFVCVDPVLDSASYGKAEDRHRPETEEARADAAVGAVLSQALCLWVSGRMSNFDYLMVLNRMAGRSLENPSHYPVMPWVKDFTSKG